MTEPQAQRKFTNQQLERIAHAVNAPVTANHVACILEAADRMEALSRPDSPQIPLPEHRVATPNHNPYHEYVTLEGNFTQKALDLFDFAEAARKFAQKVRQDYLAYKFAKNPSDPMAPDFSQSRGGR